MSLTQRYGLIRSVVDGRHLLYVTGALRRLRDLAAGNAAAAGLPVAARRTIGIGQHAPVEQALDQRDLFLDRIEAVDFALHRFRRSAAMQADQRIPAALMGGGEIGRASCRERVCQYV